MSSKIKSILKVSLSLGFGLFLVYLFYSKLSATDKEEMLNAFQNANYWWLVFSVSFTLVSQSIRSIRFQSLLSAMGYEVGFLRAFNAISINYIVNIGIPRAGEFARSGVLASYNGIPVQKSFGATINERFVDVLLLLFTGILCFLLQYEVFFNFYDTYLAESFQNLFFWLQNHWIASLALGLAFAGAAFWFWKFLFGHDKKESKFHQIVHGVKDGIFSIMHLKRPWLFILQSIGIWICYYFMIYFAFKTIEQGEILGYGAALSLLFFGTFGFLATPGGIGAYPLIAGYLLAMYGLEAHLGSTIGWILWVGQTILIIILGILAFIKLSREKSWHPNLFQDETKIDIT